MTPRDFVIWLQGVLHSDATTALKGDVFAEVRRRLFAVYALAPFDVRTLEPHEATDGGHDDGPRVLRVD